MASRFRDRSSRHFDSVAAKYDELSSCLPRDIWVRDAFRSLVVQTAAPGSLLLDFGCGTGTDALWYAERGYRLIAYDNSRSMIEQLRIKCAAQIARNQIVPIWDDYAAFLGKKLEPRVDAIVSNFAVLSVIPDLPGLFAGLADKVAATGSIVASVLNPLFWEDMLRAWWWRDFIASLGKGYIEVHEGAPPTYRYFRSRFASRAVPHFVEVSRAGVGGLVGNGSPHDWAAPRSLGERTERRLWKTWPIRDLGQYSFYVFRRCA